eukprot:CAMPEP_0171496492 /NCGR_PEP_ID=MMETSP0958-20121227/6735_1 /TAXON_ID=87120 /ORGANISM="Aurantiochytrium limacinum, Strain ATCCMYA-1381" /LENGTH=248 /DNA_ID=CAMNT_0012030607 /DNA_START=780 /DNA_END=1526 /DNA_ORIENTATION=+
MAVAMATLVPETNALFESGCLASEADSNCARLEAACQGDTTCNALLLGTQSTDMTTQVQSIGGLLQDDIGSLLIACGSCSDNSTCTTELTTAITMVTQDSNTTSAILTEMESYCSFFSLMPVAPCTFSTCMPEIITCLEDETCSAQLGSLFSGASSFQELAASFATIIVQGGLIVDALTCVSCECGNEINDIVEASGVEVTPGYDIASLADAALCSSPTSAPSPASTFSVSSSGVMSALFVAILAVFA